MNIIPKSPGEYWIHIYSGKVDACVIILLFKIHRNFYNKISSTVTSSNFRTSEAIKNICKT